MSKPIPGQPIPEPQPDQPISRSTDQPATPPLGPILNAVADQLAAEVAKLDERQPDLHAARVRDIARRVLRKAGLLLLITQSETPWIQFGDGRATARVTVLAILRWADDPDGAHALKIKGSGHATNHQAAAAAREASADAESDVLGKLFGYHYAPADETASRSRYEARLRQSLYRARDEAMRTLSAEGLTAALKAMPERLRAYEPQPGITDDRIAAVYADHGADKPKASLLDKATAWFELETLRIQWELAAAQQVSA